MDSYWILLCSSLTWLLLYLPQTACASSHLMRLEERNTGNLLLEITWCQSKWGRCWKVTHLIEKSKRKESVTALWRNSLQLMMVLCLPQLQEAAPNVCGRLWEIFTEYLRNSLTFRLERILRKDKMKKAASQRRNSLLRYNSCCYQTKTISVPLTPTLRLSLILWIGQRNST